ncbi:MAG: Hsp20/alpha crystallin family protein [Syntrophobacterales bacterium]|nr:Hsp20/alpha crystallin family protein [Syntrophobacterales bacterium]HNQ01189.1 Hsp20/alpha crystallin family protein [Syntrophales bacterium]HNS54023.1 Hsp20/alpha crystallin family protein [Syntrophales bacterium]
MFWPEFGRYGRVWSPWREMERLQQDVNRLLSSESAPYATMFPAVNIWASDQDVIVTAEVPGVDPAGLDITVADNVLRLSGSRKPEELKPGEVSHRRERASGEFTRSFRLPFAVDSGKVEAVCDRGVLTVRLPRAEADKPRKIAIKTQK